MKKIVIGSIVLLMLLSFCISCKKSDNSASGPQYTFAQAWDSVGLQYEKKYLLDDHGLYFLYEADTLVFHTDNSITETCPNLDGLHGPAILHYQSSFSNVYWPHYQFQNNGIRLAPIHDTFTNNFVLHDYLLKDSAHIYKSKMVSTRWGIYVAKDSLYLSFSAVD